MMMGLRSLLGLRSADGTDGEGLRNSIHNPR
jgi:hypothetical protein